MTVGTAGISEMMTQTGYARLTVNSGPTPFGVAVFSLKQNEVTASEAGVPASPPKKSSRIFVDYRRAVNPTPGRNDAGTVDVNTGIAIVNCSSATANVTYTLRDLNRKVRN